jgi:hypothetical protein
MNKEKNIVWFGMKVSPEEKKRIKKLAELQGINQKEAVLQAVEEKIASYEVPTKSGTLLDKLKPFAGVVNNTEGDRATNKTYLKDYGKKNSDR